MSEKTDSPILGRYKLYKAGTAKLVQWLAKTATSCCDVTSIVESVAGDAKLSRSQRRNAPAHTSVQIRTRELVALAGVIASAQPPIGIPPDVLDLLRDVITGREVCAGFYASQPADSDSAMAEQNDTHRYFIDILKQVRDILVTARVALLPKHEETAKKEQKDAGQDTLTNIFACLQLEEPSDAPLGGPAQPKLSKKSPAFAFRGAKFNLEEDYDRTFELWCFLQDLNDARTYVRESWAEYSRGDLSLLTVGMLTDTAFGMMRRADEEFAALHPYCDDHASLLKFRDSLMPAGLGVEHAAFLCPSAAAVLQDFCTQIEPYKQEVILARHHASTVSGGKSVTVIANITTRSSSSHSFDSVLLRILPEIVDFSSAVDSGTFTHPDRMAEEFVRGLASLVRGSKVPTWLVIACQTYRDIYDVVQSYPEVGADRMIDTLSDICRIIDSYGKFIKQYENKDLERAWKRRFGELRTSSGSFMATLRKAKLAVAEKDHGYFCVARQRGIPLEMMLYLPVMPSRKAFSTKGELHYEDAAIADGGCTILALAHVYEAGRQYGLITAAWHDMDFVITQHNGKQALVTRVHDSADTQAMARHFQIALGVPASRFVRPGPRYLPSADSIEKKARKLGIISPFRNAMIAGVREKRMLGGDYDDEHGETIDVVLRSLTEKADSALAAQTSQHARGLSKSQRYTPLQLLSTLKRNLTDEEPQLLFDYITFYQACDGLMFAMKKRVLATMPHDDRTKLHHGYQFVDHLLWKAADAVTSGRPLNSTHFGQAAVVMQAHIVQEGKRFSNKV